jgi:GntR family transcriptional regulator, rspAB operon transcriptional repressor
MFSSQEEQTCEARDLSDKFKAGQAYSRLKSLLVTRQIPSLTKLDAAVLSEYLGVSRTPVREALIHLSIEEIVLNVPGSGFFSKQLDVNELLEDYEMASMILKCLIEEHWQPQSKLRVALSPPPLFDDLDPDPTRRAQFRTFIEGVNEDIVKASGNRRYLQIIQAFNSRTAFVRQEDLEREDRRSGIGRDMAELIDLLRRRQARDAMANIDRQFTELVGILPQLVRQSNRRGAQRDHAWLDLLR